MPDIQKLSIALTGEQVASLKKVVASGEYATTSEAIREALRDWQRKRELHERDLRKLRQLWTEGKRSGVAVPANLSEVRYKAQKRLSKVAGAK